MTPNLTPENRDALIDLAEEVIRRSAIDGMRHVPESEPGGWAQPKRATFVTVYLNDELNGCIGTLEARRPLWEDIGYNAHRAAFHDPRFPAIGPSEVNDVTVHISVLGDLEPMTVRDEHDLLRQMRPGVDGIVLDDGVRRGTFLPSVWEKLPEPVDFLLHLKRKARIAADEWPTGIKVFRFEVEEFGSDVTST